MTLEKARGGTRRRTARAEVMIAALAGSKPPESRPLNRPTFGPIREIYPPISHLSHAIRHPPRRPHLQRDIALPQNFNSLDPASVPRAVRRLWHLACPGFPSRNAGGWLGPAWPEHSPNLEGLSMEASRLVYMRASRVVAGLAVLLAVSA